MGNTIMDNRNLLEKLTNSFNRNDPTLFFQAGGKFSLGRKITGISLKGKVL
jgi:hypothetical protein